MNKRMTVLLAVGIAAATIAGTVAVLQAQDDLGDGAQKHCYTKTGTDQRLCGTGTSDKCTISGNCAQPEM